MVRAASTRAMDHDHWGRRYIRWNRVALAALELKRPP